MIPGAVNRRIVLNKSRLQAFAPGARCGSSNGCIAGPERAMAIAPDRGAAAIEE